jgi:hypothetical protein
MCFGYLAGVQDRDIAAGTDREFCVPASATNNHAMDLVLSYIRSHPEVRPKPTLGAILLAYDANFPCHHQR